MKRFSWIATAFLFLAACRGGVRAEIPVDGYAAMVNDRVIMVSDVREQMRPVIRQLNELFSGEQLDEKLDEAYSNALNALIERELIISDFQMKGGSIPDNVVDGRIEEILRNRFKGDRVELMKALDEEGMTLGEWREDIRGRIIVSLMREQAVDSKINVSPKDMREAYEQNIADHRIPEQVELRMIVISRGKTAEEDAVKRKHAEDIRNRLLAGEKFEELAKAVSEGVKAASGGYHGRIDPSTRRAEISRAIAALAIAEISEIVETDEDFFIIRIEDRTSAGLTPFDKVASEISERLRNEQAKKFYDEWISRLKEKAYIKKM